MFCTEFLKRLPSPEQQKFYLRFIIYDIFSHYCSACLNYVYVIRIMQDVHVKLNLLLPQKKQHSTRGRHFYQKIGHTGFKFKEESGEILHFEHSFVWCRSLGTSKISPKCLGSFHVRCWGKDGVAQLARSCEKRKVLRTVKEERKILGTLKRGGNWIYHFLPRKCLLQHLIQGKIYGMGRR